MQDWTIFPYKFGVLFILSMYMNTYICFRKLKCTKKINYSQILVCKKKLTVNAGNSIMGKVSCLKIISSSIHRAPISLSCEGNGDLKCALNSPLKTF